VSGDIAAKFAWDLMNEAQREHFRTQRDLDLSWESPHGRFRVNVFRQRQKVGMVLRRVPSEVSTIGALGLPAVLVDFTKEQNGIILVTGATGSGKSTTMAAMVEEINRTTSSHILTIEDPIEFTYSEQQSIINQREIHVDSDSFASALHAAVRQDPDVIMVGELRDRATAEIALQAAETGHLVLSTLHTIDAPSTLSRLVGFFEPHHQPSIRQQLAATLRGVVSMRLLPSIAGGRVAATEILVNTGAVPRCITDPARLKEIPDIMARSKSVYGTQTFDQSIFELLKDGIISEATARRFVSNRDELDLRLAGFEKEA